MATEYQIDATAWDVRHDVDDAFSAASFSVEYERVGSDMRWDPLIFDQLKVYDGGDDPDTVRIESTVEGVRGVVLEKGIVDRSGWEDREGGVVVGRLEGRDLMALALDKGPGTAFTVGLGTPYDTLHRALAKLASEAGLHLTLQCPDYPIGRSVAVAAESRIGQVMQQLIEPFRWSEKHRVDAWMDGDRMVVAQRSYTSPAGGIVEIDAARLYSVRMDKTRLPELDDVQVLGATFRTTVPDFNDETFPRSTFVETERTVTEDKGLTMFREHERIEYDELSRVTSRTYKRVYILRANFSTKPPSASLTIRYVEEKDIYDYYTEADFPFKPDSPVIGQPKRKTSTVYVIDHVPWPITASSRIVAGFTKEQQTEYKYYEDTAEPRWQYMFSTEKQDNELDAGSGDRKLDRTVTERKTWLRSGDRMILEMQTTTFGPEGEVISDVKTSQVSPAKSPPLREPGSVLSRGFKQLEGQYSAGPATSSGLMRREQSDLLGSNEACQAIRQQLLDEHASVKIGASFRLPADLRIRPGKLLRVLNAPSWWPMTEFYVTSVVLSAGTGLDSTVEGLNWV